MQLFFSIPWCNRYAKVFFNSIHFIIVDSFSNSILLVFRRHLFIKPNDHSIINYIWLLKIFTSKHKLSSTALLCTAHLFK